MIRNIHLIFKTHLDVGFTNYASVVVQEYFDRFIPAALQLARQMRVEEPEDRFIWTTGSWLIYEVLEQANPDRRREMERAIELGDIVWHALPFTTHTELMDADLFRFGLSLSGRLDARFGKRTIAAKFTDVPGPTRGIVPLLAEAGVQFLHIGINPGSTVPSVPPLFRWQDPSGSEVIVMVESGYGSAFVVPETEDALAFFHSIDNLGPQSLTEVKTAYATLRARYPGARVFASTLNAFAETLLPIRESLPVVNQEIGDTWIHGIGSDPIKVSQYRELLRLRSQWMRENPDLVSDEAFDRFQRRLLIVPEHTWGMDEKTFLGDHENYSAEKFSAARSRENFRTFEKSWAEKRAYIDAAVRELDGTVLAREARQRLEVLQPRRPDLTDWEAIQDFGEKIDGDYFTYCFDPETGSLVWLVDRVHGKTWADAGHPLGLLRYQTFSAQDYERFFRQYIRPEEQENGWAREDFTKPGLEAAAPLSRFWHPKVKAMYRKRNQWLWHLTGDPLSVREYGCPQHFYLNVEFAAESPEVRFDLQWFDKPACRLPEALWFGFSPLISSAADWQIEKLGEFISPLEVVKNGNRHLHACGGSVMCRDGDSILTIVTLDAPLVAPGEPSLLNFTNEQPDLSRGVHFNLYNNVWGTNFPMWFEEDCRFRFVLKFRE